MWSARTSDCWLLTFKQDFPAGPAVNIHLCMLMKRAWTGTQILCSGSAFSYFLIASLSLKTLSRVPPPSFLFALFLLWVLRSTSPFLLPGAGESLPGSLSAPVEGRVPSPLLSPLSLQPEPASGIRCLRRRSTPTAPFLSLFPPFLRFSFACNSSSPPYISFTVSNRRELKAEKVVLLQILLETTWDL